MRVLVTGAGGFIGGNLCRYLKNGGDEVFGVDIKPVDKWFQCSAEFSIVHDCAADSTVGLVAGIEPDVIYNLAADMGGMGFIEENKALCMLNVRINTNVLLGAKALNKKDLRYFYSSSACAYPLHLQRDSADVVPLAESDAYPADPEDGYGWEKLFSERMCQNFREDFGIETRIARFHNVYGPTGEWIGGREKAPAAICRKIAEAKLSGEARPWITIWGDGSQARSFMWIGDCIEGIEKIAYGNYPDPINLGSSALITVNDLVSLVEEIAGIKVQRDYDLFAPTGVRGRNSDNTLIRQLYGWEPSTPLVQGLEATYRWVYDQLASRQ